MDEQPWNAEQARSTFCSWFLSYRSSSSTGQCQWVQWADRKKWPYFYFLYNPLLICIPILAVIRETWKIQQQPISKLMQQKNICWRGYFRAVPRPCFAMEAFQAWTKCHEHSDVFLRLQGAWNNRLRPVTAPAPSVCWSCQLRSPPARSWISTDHVASEVFAVLAEIGGIPPSRWPWSAVMIGSTSIWTRLTCLKRSERKMGAWTRAGTAELV